MHLTVKQIELLSVISRGNGANDPADLDEILDRVRYETTKQSLQFSIRALIKHGLIAKKGIEKRRGRQRQVIEATELGHQMAGSSRSATPAYVSSVEEDDLRSEVVEFVE